MKNRLILLTSLLTVFFLMSIAFNIFPFLRGPVDHLIPSRWPYYFVNTLNKIWAPALIFLSISALYLIIEKRKKIKLRHEWKFLVTLVILTFFFQLSLVYFSRFGIKILFRRLVDPGINGYFSSAIRIEKIKPFLNKFPQTATNLDQHARDHPPGTVLFIKAIINIFKFIQKQTNFFSRLDTLQVSYSRILWRKLTLDQKAASLFLAFFTHFLTSLVIIPFYFLIKKFAKGISITPFQGTFLYALMPSFSFFALLFDPIYAVFPFLSFILLFKTRQNPTDWSFISGIIFGIGLFFSLSILPILLGLVIYATLTFILEKDKKIVLKALEFAFGILSFFTILYLFGFNFLASFPAIIKNQVSREYLPWLIFNPYDFFLYLGVPISILFIFYSIKSFSKPINLYQNNNKLFITFWVTFLILIISGISRGEVGRIWQPLMFIPIIFVSQLKLKRNQFIIVLILLFLQLIVMEEFWVPVW